MYNSKCVCGYDSENAVISFLSFLINLDLVYNFFIQTWLDFTSYGEDLAIASLKL